MEHSTAYFGEIFTFIMLMIEYNFLDNEKLPDMIKNLFINLIHGFEKVQLDNLKDKINEDYYSDLISSINKGLMCVIRGLAKTKLQEATK